MNIRIVLLTALLLMLDGCASADRGVMTRMEPMELRDGAQMVRFIAIADAVYPAESSKAEATRLKWLRQSLMENGYGDKPFTIVQRRTFVRTQTLFGAVQDIYYDVRIGP